MAALVVWSFAGTVPRTVNGSGVVAQPGGLAEVGSTVNGQVTKVMVSEDQFVEQGEPVAEIASAGKQTVVNALYSGQIIDLTIIPGQVVQFGQPLYTVQRLTQGSGGTFVYLFVPSSTGAGLGPGMSVNISVATAPSAKYGVLRGKIATISETPLSTEAVSALVANPDLAQVLTKSGPPLLAEVKLTPDAKTKSGFKWSTPDGPPFPLEPGTPVTAQVIQQEQHPINVVFGS